MDHLLVATPEHCEGLYLEQSTQDMDGDHPATGLRKGTEAGGRDPREEGKR